MTTTPSVLVTAARFEAATAVVRGFHKVGANVHAADNYKMAPALHSHAHSTVAHVVPSPSHEPLRFAEEVAQIVRDHRIDLVAPSFEEGFFLRRYADMIPAPIFAPSFETISQLHDKARFAELCPTLGLSVPKTSIATNQDELREATKQFDEFAARPAFSRGGMYYLTNHGPRAAEKTIDDYEPTNDNPWLVQEYIDGDDTCSFSVVRNGKIVLHCVYEPTIAAAGGWSLQFESIDDFGSLDAASRIAEHFNYDGFLSFDYRRTPAVKGGFVMIECNPRVSAGAFLVKESWLGEAVLDEPGEVRIVKPGARRQYDQFLLNPMIADLPSSKVIHELLTTPDVLFEPSDVLPSLYLLISMRHFSALAKAEHVTVAKAFLDDITWDGAPLPEPDLE